MAGSAMKIEGVHPAIDGVYPLDPSAFTNRDYSDIKRIAKVRAREIQEAFEAGDIDLFVAFAAIALRHAGKPAVEDALWDAAVGQITFDAGDEEEADELPPVSPPPSEPSSAAGGGERLSVESERSGSPSNIAAKQADEPAKTQRAPVRNTQSVCFFSRSTDAPNATASKASTPRNTEPTYQRMCIFPSHCECRLTST